MDEFASHADMTLVQCPPLANVTVVEQEIFDALTRQQLPTFQLEYVADVNADLTMLGRLALALAKARAVPIAA